MAKKARRYTVEFRTKAIRLASESDKPIAETARDLDVPYQTLYQWMQKAGLVGAAVGAEQARSRSSSPVARRGAPDESSDDEARRLRRELDEVKRERDFLKKAAAFFAQMNK